MTRTLYCCVPIPDKEDRKMTEEKVADLLMQTHNEMGLNVEKRGQKLARKCLSPMTRLVSGLTMTKHTIGTSNRANKQR